MIKSIVCSSDTGECSTDVIAELNRNIGAFFFSISPRLLENRIVNADTRVGSANVSVQFPSRLLARLSMRKPFGQIGLGPSSLDVLVVDNQGLVLSTLPFNEHLPLVSLGSPSDLTIGDRLDPALLKAVHLSALLAGIAQSEIAPLFASGVLQVQIHEGPLVTFSLEKDSLDQLATLQLLLDQARIEQTTYSTIDLRFGRPVMTK